MREEETKKKFFRKKIVSQPVSDLPTAPVISTIIVHPHKHTGTHALTLVLEIFIHYVKREYVRIFVF